MHRARHYIISLSLAVAFAAPAMVMATPVPPEADVQVRIYDKNHKDHHNWDDHENHAWGQFLVEKHKPSHDYQKSNKKEQSQYWNWRHEHPDKH